MKALLAILFTSLLIFSAACSNDDSSSNSEGTDNNTSSDTTKTTDEGTTDEGTGDTEENDNSGSEMSDKQKQASALMSFELELTPQIHTAQAPFNSLAVLAGGEKLDQKQLKQAADAAVQSGNDFASSLESMEVPSDLPQDMQDKVKSALSDLAASYKARAEAAGKTKNASSLEELQTKVDAMAKAAQPKFDSFNSTLNELHKTLGLSEADYSSELN